MVGDGRKYAMGWIPDYPDLRDYTEKTEEVKKVLMQTQLLKKKTLPKSVDLREWCSPVEDQGMLGSCTSPCRCWNHRVLREKVLWKAHRCLKTFPL